VGTVSRPSRTLRFVLLRVVRHSIEGKGGLKAAPEGRGGTAGNL